MRISDERIKSLQMFLKELGFNYSDEQAQEAGLAIIRFMIAKAQRNNKLINEMEIDNE